MRAVSQASKSYRARGTALRALFGVWTAGPSSCGGPRWRSSSPGRSGLLILLGTLLTPWFGAHAAAARAPTPVSIEAGSCEVRLVAQLEAPPLDHLAAALHAWHTGIADRARLELALATAGGRLDAELQPLPNGAELVMRLSGPQRAFDAMRVAADVVAAAFQPARFDLGAIARDHAAGREIADVDTARAALAATQRFFAPDADTEMAKSRLLLLLDGATLARSETCDGAKPPPGSSPSDASEGARLLPTTETAILRAAIASATRPPRVFLVAPMSTQSPRHADDIPTLLAYLNHPGSTHFRALVSPTVRGVGARATFFAGASVLVVAIDLDPSADWHDSVREAQRALPVARPEPAELAGAAIIAGASPAAAQRARELLAETLSLRNVGWVFIPSSRALETFAETSLDAFSRAQYVAASVELACPAPGDTRPPEERLKQKLGMDAEVWRRLARTVAADRDALSGLTREFEDRCGELATLRRIVNPALFTRFYREHHCRVALIEDPELAWAAQQRLMQGLGLDSALYRPMIDMAAGDPRLEEAMRAVHAACPRPTAPGGGL